MRPAAFSGCVIISDWHRQRGVSVGHTVAGQAAFELFWCCVENQTFVSCRMYRIYLLTQNREEMFSKQQGGTPVRFSLVVSLFQGVLPELCRSEGRADLEGWRLGSAGGRDQVRHV